MSYKRHHIQIKKSMIFVLNELGKLGIEELKTFRINLKILLRSDSDGWLTFLFTVFFCAYSIKLVLLMTTEIFQELIKLYSFQSTNALDNLYWGIWAVSIIFFVITGNRKNIFTEAAISIMPATTLYALKTAVLLKPLGLVITVFLFLYIFVIFVQIIGLTKRKRKKSKWIQLGLRKICSLAQKIIVLMSIICLFIPHELMLQYQDIPSQSGVILNIDSLLDSNTEILRQLSPKIFYYSSLEEQENALQGLADLEAVYLGVDFVDLEIKDLREQTLGFYNPTKNKIFINELYLKNVPELINTVLHEMFHVYERAMVRKLKDLAPIQGSLFYREITCWKKEFDHYQSADYYGFDKYYGQEIERSAREYASKRGPIYLEYINELE